MTGFDTYFIYKTGIIDSLSTLEEGLHKLDSKPGGYLWLDYYAPSKDNLALLIEPLGIHYLSLEDCLDDNQIPKINEWKLEDCISGSIISHSLRQQFYF
jgi:magnesium transporter